MPGADGDDLAFQRLFLRGIGQKDSAFGHCFFRDGGFNHDIVV
jgi:hypothetical protein